MPANCSNMFREQDSSSTESSALKIAVDLKGVQSSEITKMANMFLGCVNLTAIDFTDFDTSNVTSMNDLFWGCASLENIDVSGFNTSKVTTMQAMFYNCSKLKTINVSGFNTSNVTTMKSLFSNCSNLESVDVSGFNTSKVTTMWAMFNNCSKLQAIDVSGFDTGNVTNMESLFNNCSQLKSLNVSQFNTSKVTTMNCMFWNCQKLENIDVSGFDTSNVADMMSLFSHCDSLKSVDVSGFNTSKVTTMRAMFYGCSKLKSVDVSNFDTSNVTNMLHMFIYCSSLESLDLSNFDTSEVANAGLMFSGCSGLKSLKISDTFTLSGNASTDRMFDGCDTNLRIIGNGDCEFIEANSDAKNAIDTKAEKVYVTSGNSGISDSLQTVLNDQLSQAELVEEIEPSALFSTSADDVAYVGMITADQVILADGNGKTISGALTNNKSYNEVGYYPSALQLTGTITLSGDNSAFTQKSLIVGDGAKATTVTLTSPSSLPKTEVIIEANGNLAFSGTSGFILSKNVTVKPGGYLQSSQRIILTDGAILKFGK